MTWIDDFLDQITMYRLVLYSLLALIGIAAGYGAVGLVPYSPFLILGSASLITLVCWVTNTGIAWLLKAPTNVESVYITAFILAFIITPTHFILAIVASILAMASKYILAIGKKHIFNPVAIAVALTAIVMGQSATWWIGTAVMAPWVLVLGVLIVRKIQRWDLVLSFFGVAFLLTLGSLQREILDSPILFFAFIMLTEPLTTPPTASLRIAYGMLVGALVPPFIHIGSVYSTPELALLVGNIFSYAVSPKEKLMLRLQEKIQTAPNTYDFIFRTDHVPAFRPGQYMEWTLGHTPSDSRGTRRYFTIASAPTEKEIRIGVIFHEQSSSFKRALLAMKKDEVIVASQLAGDFTLPKNPTRKLVFIAGGIGVTPFRSMVKYLLDTGEHRDIVLWYSAKEGATVYREIFDEASRVFGLTAHYVTGRLDPQAMMQAMPDYRERTYYISGPGAMIISFEEVLKELGIPAEHIKTDFFPGFA